MSEKRGCPPSGQLLTIIMMSLVTGFMLVTAVVAAAVPDFTNLRATVSAIPVIPVLLAVCLLAGGGVTAGLLVGGFGERFLPRIMALSVFICALSLAANAQTNVYFVTGLGAVVAVFLYKTRCHELTIPAKLRPLLDRDLSRRLILLALFLLFTLVIGITTSFRYSTFSSTTFDFGIFIQAMENMARGGAPLTTVERGRELTHFAVHFSPVLYLLQPFYYIFRSPYFLFWAAAALIGAGVFPLAGICRKLGLGTPYVLGFSILYILYPVMGNANFTDFHENVFLPLFILLTVWFALSGKAVPTAVFSLALLSVKEDAAVYAVALALWMILSGKPGKIRWTGLGIMAGSVLYFLLATRIIVLCGGEIMTSRFADYQVGSGGLFEVAKNLFLDAGYLLSRIFTEGRFQYWLWMLVPLLALPVRADVTWLPLMIPMLVINLMPEWKYQYNVSYQYSFGTGALLIVLAAVSLLRIKESSLKKYLMMTAICLCIIFSAGLTLHNITYYTGLQVKNGQTCEEVQKALDKLPKDASVTATTCLCPHLYDIKELYTVPIYYESYRQTDYYIEDTRNSSSKADYDKVTAQFERWGYVPVLETGFIRIWSRTGAPS